MQTMREEVVVTQQPNVGPSGGIQRIRRHILAAHVSNTNIVLDAPLIFVSTGSTSKHPAISIIQ